MRQLASIVAAASLTCALLQIASSEAARATDDIQIDSAGIADVGRLTIQQHLNYVALGPTAARGFQP